MGKEGDLWDDSALINAFDNAISKYKIMHSKGGHDSSAEEGKVISSREENLAALVDESHKARRHMEADDSSNVASNTTAEMGETSNLSPIKENHRVDSFAPEPYMGSSNGQHMQDVPKGYSNTQGVGDYNQLLNQYYELEEQRQKILQQLHQFGSWNYQVSGSNIPWSNSSTSQEHQVSAAPASCPTAVCSCCPYACQCLVAPCSSLPSCSFGGTCVAKTCDASSAIGWNGKSIPLEEGDFIKTAMGAAERALSSLKINTSGNCDVNEEKEREREVETNVSQSAQISSSETDLTVVLNAWYSAGFYTGKYLTEQSFAKK